MLNAYCSRRCCMPTRHSLPCWTQAEARRRGPTSGLMPGEPSIHCRALCTSSAWAAAPSTPSPSCREATASARTRLGAALWSGSCRCRRPCRPSPRRGWWARSTPRSSSARGSPPRRRARRSCRTPWAGIKWFSHPAGHPNGEAKPLSEGRTMSVLVSPASEFRIEFSIGADFAPQDTLSHSLRRHGDFVIRGPGVFHRAFGVQPACILTVRWFTPR